MYKRQDSTYALAHAGLADLYDSYRIQTPIGDTLERANYLALMEQESAKAFQLNPKLAYVNQVRGYALSRSNQTDDAFRHFINSYEISPNNPEAITGLSNLYFNMGLHQDALQFAERATEIDPLHKSGLLMEMYGNFYLGNLDQTIQICQSILTIDPNNLSVLHFLFRSQFILKQTEAALATWANMEQIDSIFTKKTGQDLEISLLKQDTTYLNKILDGDNANLKFITHWFQNEADLAAKEFQLATEDYLTFANTEDAPSGSIYLDLYHDPMRTKYLETAWFKEALGLEKRKFDFLQKKYPRAAQILGIPLKN